MNDDDQKQIIEMKAETTDQGEIRYTQSDQKPGGSPPPNWLIRLAGAAIGVAVFLCLIFLFVYVIVPLLVIAAIWMLVRNFFRR